MDELPLTRMRDGRLSMTGYGIVRLEFNYQHVLGKGGQGVVFGGRIFYVNHGRESLVMKVALKVNTIVHDPRGELKREAELHAHAYARLDNVLKLLGFLEAHAPSDAPAVLVMEVATPMSVFLAESGPLIRRDLNRIKAITRIVNQLLRFLVAADEINFMHKDVKVENIFVRNSDDIHLAELAMGDFGGAQSGLQTEDGEITYRPGIYTWHQTSPRMAGFIYRTIAEEGIPRRQIALSRQLTFYNDLFGWARVAFVALADQSPPDMLYGPSPRDYMSVPALGCGVVLDAVHRLLRFALDVLTVGGVEKSLRSNCVTSLHWYDELPHILSGSRSPDAVPRDGCPSVDEAW